MIQRIQTVYLFLAAVCMALQLFFPTFIVIKEIDGKTTETMLFLSQGLFTKIIFVLLTLFPIAGIMLYKKRGKQIMVTRLGLISYVGVAIGFLVLAFFGKDFLIGYTIAHIILKKASRVKTRNIRLIVNVENQILV